MLFLDTHQGLVPLWLGTLLGNSLYFSRLDIEFRNDDQFEYVPVSRC